MLGSEVLPKVNFAKQGQAPPRLGRYWRFCGGLWHAVFEARLVRVLESGQRYEELPVLRPEVLEARRCLSPLL